MPRHTPKNDSPAKVFISCAEEDFNTAKRLYDDLKKNGLTPWLGNIDLLPGQDKWHTISNTIRKGDYFIAVLSAQSVSQRGEFQKELKKALNILDEFPPNSIFLLPVRVDECESAYEELRDYQRADLFPSYGEGLKKILLALGVKSPLSRSQEPQPSPGMPHQTRTFLYKLPISGPDLFGREKELKMLDNAWEDPDTNILSLVAWGGTGKTALVNHWVCNMGKDHYRGAERAYAWSFYSQGASEGKQASADEFLAHALKWFGDPNPAEGSGFDKGVRLAELIQQTKTLLILDGLEPVQYPPGEMQGRLKDQGLQALLRSLAYGHPGLCVITTRLAVADLAMAENSAAPRVDLESLPVEAGVALLDHLGVSGMKDEMLKAVTEYGCHALSLNLLGSYVKTVFKGDIRRRDGIPKLTVDRKYGGHAWRVMAAYKTHLAETPELNILYLMGLFDRPAESGAIEALREEPPIIGLTDELTISEVDYQFALEALRELKLISDEDPSRPDTLDCHPLVREYFGENLQKNNPNAWQKAHSRLYEYYKNLPEKEFPGTLEEMEPLFAACAHGAMAGRHQETMDNVYWKRIRRKEEAYSVHKLGAFGSDLSALSNFFDEIWSKPAAGLNDKYQALIPGWAGYRLWALGRLREAAQPIQVGLKLLTLQKDWGRSAEQASNLSGLWLTLGAVKKAVTFARQSVDFADRNENLFWKGSTRTTLSDALHQAGNLEEAEHCFREAEMKNLMELWFQYPFLYSLQGFRFCDLLLSSGLYAEVLKRAGWTLENCKGFYTLLDFALDKLSIGRAHLFKALLEKTGDFTEATKWQNAAVDGLRKAGVQEFIARGLLARAELHRHKKDYPHAQADLKEVLEIAQFGDMKLHLTDYHLESCRLCIAMNQPEKAEEHRQKAEKLIEETGYFRRKAELEELGQARE